MNDHDDIRDDGELEPLAQELHHGRPLLSPATRSRIRSMIAEAGPLRERPENLRGMIFLYTVSGGALLAIGYLGAVGAGPL